MKMLNIKLLYIHTHLKIVLTHRQKIKSNIQIKFFKKKMSKRLSKKKGI